MADEYEEQGEEAGEMTMSDAQDQPTDSVDLEEKKAQLLADLQSALDKGEFNEVAKVSREIAKVEAEARRAEVEALQEMLAETTEKVRGILDKAVAKMKDAGDLEGADGVWYSNDFSGTDVSGIKLLKLAPRKTGKGTQGDTTRKFSIKTEELLAQFGGEIIPEGGKLSAYAGQTYQQAYDASTEGNHRYQVRTALLKLGGYC